MAALHYGVSERRIQQLTKYYRQTGHVPKLNPNRRPKAPPLTKEEKQLIDQTWERYQFRARMIYKHLKSQGTPIPLHKIHHYLVRSGRSKPNPNKQKKRKRCRYERTHSFSLLHGDWHRSSINHPHAIIWLDDASRFILSGGEFVEATSEHAITTMKEAITTATTYNAIIREVNTDRGTQFFTYHPNSKNAFELFLENQGIVHIVSRKGNPQTNGKIERFWYEYDQHRWRYDSLEEFIDWYNERMHGSLWTEVGENPAEAVLRKNRPEALLGLFWGWAE